MFETVDNVERRGVAGREVGGEVKGRGVAGHGQDEIEGVDVADRDHARERGSERKVVHPRLRPLLLVLGHLEGGLGDPDGHLCLGEHGLGGHQFRLRPLDGRLCLVARCDARLELIVRLEEDVRIDHALGDLALEPLDLRVPAVNLGLVLGQDFFGLFQAQLPPP